MFISLRTNPRAFQMQEARSAAYFTHYTNLFGSLSHQPLTRDSWSLWLMRLQMMLHWSLLKSTTCITGTLTWGTLKDNSVCCQIFWTAALDMPLRSPLFAPWQTCLPLHHWLPGCLVRYRQTGEDLSHNPGYHCNRGKVLFCPPMHQTLPEIYHVPGAPQEHNAPQCHKDLTDGLDLATIARQFVDANERRRHFFGTVHSPQWNPPERLGITLGTVRLELFGNLTTCILLYLLMTTVYDCRLHDCGWYCTMLAPFNEQLITLSIAFYFCL